ncbi:hypothetical protein IW262DRAFT_1397206, partial [Armillaria fumosa]
MTFQKNSPSLASDGDYAHSPPSRIVGTMTSVAPPQQPTQRDIIIVLLFVVWPPSSHGFFRRQHTSTRSGGPCQLSSSSSVSPSHRCCHLSQLYYPRPPTHDDSFPASNSDIDYRVTTAGKSCSTSPSVSTKIRPEPFSIPGMLTGIRFRIQVTSRASNKRALH